jgi:hypothetical protein
MKDISAEPQPFSLSELVQMECPPHEPFHGTIKQSIIDQKYDQRLQESRRQSWHPCLKPLAHLADHLVGLAQDIEVELRGSE